MHVFLLKADDRSAICYTVNQERFSKFLTWYWTGKFDAEKGQNCGNLFLPQSQFAKNNFCCIQNVLKGSLIIFNNVILRFKVCVEIFFVFSYLLSWRNKKFCCLNHQSNFKQHDSDNAKGAEFKKLCIFRVQLTLKKCCYTKTECSIKWKLFHFSVMFSHWHKTEITLIHFEILLGTLPMPFFAWAR